jgi:hypothetical protein
MDQLHRWGLGNVPTEILGHVCDYLRMSDIRALCLIGAPLLVHKLHHDACMSTAYYVQNRSYPSELDMVYNLGKLSRLVLRNFSQTFCASVLEKVKLAGRMERLEYLAVNTIADGSLLFTRSTELWSEDNFDSLGVLLNFAKAMPSLTYLKHVGPDYCEWTTSEPFRCPPNLRTLELSPSDIPLRDVLFPSHLTCLRFKHTDLMTPENLVLLPRTLTELHTSCHTQQGKWDHSQVENFLTHYSGKMTRAQWFQLFDSDEFEFQAQEYGPEDPSVHRLRSLWEKRNEGFGGLKIFPNLKTLLIFEPQVEILGEMIRLPKQLKSFSLLSSVYWSHYDPILDLLYPPGLTYLDEGILDYGNRPGAQYSSLLPRGLTHLHMRHVTVGDSDEESSAFFEALPPTLTSIELGSILPSKLSKIPSNLVYLALPVSHSFQPADIRRLPRTITSLSAIMRWTEDEVHQDELNGISFKLAPGQVSSVWPPHLTSLKITAASRSVINIGILDHVPKTVQNLKLYGVQFDDDVLALLAHSNPKGLAFLTSSGLKKPAFECYNITSHRDVKGAISFKFTEKSLPLLYAHTQELDDDLFDQLDDASFRLFEKLHTLRLESLKRREKYSMSLLAQLPRSVAVIRSHTSLICDDRLFTMLPKSVTKFYGTKVKITLNTLYQLYPSSLSVLDVDTLLQHYKEVLKSFQGRIILEERDFELALEETKISELRFPETLSSISLPCGLPDPIFWALLPRQLTHLSVRITSETHFTNDSMKLLPSTLLHLELINENIMNSEGVAHLPMLHTLILASNSTMDDTAVGLLPQSLKVLNLNSNDKLTNHAAPLFPRDLEELHIASARISQHSFSELPRQLTLLDLSGSEGLAWADPDGLPTSLKILHADERFLRKCRNAGLNQLSLDSCSSGQFVKNTEAMVGLFDDF